MEKWRNEGYSLTGTSWHIFSPATDPVHTLGGQSKKIACDIPLSCIWRKIRKISIFTKYRSFLHHINDNIIIIWMFHVKVRRQTFQKNKASRKFSKYSINNYYFTPGVYFFKKEEILRWITSSKKRNLNRKKDFWTEKECFESVRVWFICVLY